MYARRKGTRKRRSDWETDSDDVGGGLLQPFKPNFNAPVAGAKTAAETKFVPQAWSSETPTDKWLHAACQSWLMECATAIVNAAAKEDVFTFPKEFPYNVLFLCGSIAKFLSQHAAVQVSLANWVPTIGEDLKGKGIVRAALIMRLMFSLKDTSHPLRFTIAQQFNSIVLQLWHDERRRKGGYRGPRAAFIKATHNEMFTIIRHIVLAHFNGDTGALESAPGTPDADIKAYINGLSELKQFQPDGNSAAESEKKQPTDKEEMLAHKAVATQQLAAVSGAGKEMMSALMKPSPGVVEKAIRDGKVTAAQVDKMLGETSIMGVPMSDVAKEAMAKAAPIAAAVKKAPVDKTKLKEEAGAWDKATAKAWNAKVKENRAVVLAAFEKDPNIDPTTVRVPNEDVREEGSWGDCGYLVTTAGGPHARMGQRAADQKEPEEEVAI